MKKLFIAPLAALLFAGSAGAAQLQTLTLREQAQTKDQLAREVVEVRGHREAASIILTDALYGGVAGLAIGGAVALIEQDNNWGRDLGVGAGVGLLVGALFGIVDSATLVDQAPHPGSYQMRF